jgi:hypothetical protein
MDAKLRKIAEGVVQSGLSSASAEPALASAKRLSRSSTSNPKTVGSDTILGEMMGGSSPLSRSTSGDEQCHYSRGWQDVLG